jgi:hypothetical protein
MEPAGDAEKEQLGFPGPAGCRWLNGQAARREREPGEPDAKPGHFLLSQKDRRRPDRQIAAIYGLNYI